MSEPIVRVGVATIINRKGEILLGLRKGSHEPGTWSLPGGHIDFGEEPKDTARREILEETGMRVGVITCVDALPYINTHFRESNKQYITLYFEAEYLGGEPNLMEPHKCERWDWFEIDDLPEPLFESLAYSKIFARCPTCEERPNMIAWCHCKVVAGAKLAKQYKELKGKQP